MESLALSVVCVLAAVAAFAVAWRRGHHAIAEAVEPAGEEPSPCPASSAAFAQTWLALQAQIAAADAMAIGHPPLITRVEWSSP
ncbi:MAG TPA: hypothetical protein VFQ53_08930 [Kofleriaceae bacterium]|nr:hypothetical protein [Kofleriaceae bacterium]